MYDYTEYDKITDVLPCYLSPTISLMFVTVLGRKAKDGSRRFFEYNTEYPSQYIGGNNVAKAIKRQMLYYFVLDIKNDFGGGIIMREMDVFFLKTIIETKVLPWYIGKKGIYKIIDKRLTIAKEWSMAVYTQSEYKFIEFEPILIEYGDGKFKEGIKMKINLEGHNGNPLYCVEVDLDTFMRFYTILVNTNMYNAACTNAAYAKIPVQDNSNIKVYRSGVGLAGGVPKDTWNNEVSPDKTENNISKNDFLNSI